MATVNLAPHFGLRQGAIYEDKAKNIVRLVSVDTNYCAYVVLMSRSQMHGMISGLSTRASFLTSFAWVAHSEADWTKSKEAQRAGELANLEPRGPSAYQVA